MAAAPGPQSHACCGEFVFHPYLVNLTPARYSGAPGSILGSSAWALHTENPQTEDS